MSERFNQIVNSSKPVLVDFYADWCIPCKEMAPVLKEVKNQFRNNIRIIKVNIDHHPDIANNCKINNIPAVVLFRDGQIHWSGKGVLPAHDITFALIDVL
jgi:thioredoxin 1